MRDDAGAAASDTATASADSAAGTDDADDAAAADLLRERDRLRAHAAAVPALERDVQRMRLELAAIDDSPAWRITAPLRGARALVANRRALALAAGRRVKRRLER
jgi:hypothetical protein